MKRVLSCLFLTLVLCGCATYKKEFVMVVDDHNQITHETTAAVIKSIDAALAENLPDTERQRMLDLKLRLEYMDSSADVIRKYIYANKVDEELLQELIRNKWKSQ